jgi:DNA-binding CsgD family transcriptional regulator
MASEDLSPQQWHYTLELPVELIVPSPSKQKDFLRHPRCDSAEVEELHKAGQVLEDIAATLGVSKYIARKVVKALGLQPNRRAHISYLCHPVCEAKEVLRLRAEGLSFFRIGQRLGVSKPTVGKVFRALEAAAPELIAALPAFRPRRRKRVNYLAHPKCSAEEVVRLRLDNKTFADIASELGVSIATVRSVLSAIRASGSEVSRSVLLRGQRIHPPKVDYLHHPRCDAAKLLDLQSKGLTISQVMEELHVSSGLVYRVLRAIRKK